MPVTEYGFTYGPAEVVRLHSGEAYGVAIEIKGKRGNVIVRVTPGGRVRIERQSQK